MIIDNLTLTDLIGKGAFSDVYLTTKKESPKLYATKVIDLSSIKNDEKQKDYLDKEMSILIDVNHPNIIELIEIKKKEDKIYIVTEYCNGGTLSKYLEKYQKENKKALPEKIVQYVMRQIVEGMKYLNDKNIMHRSINLENILINYEDEEDKKNNNIMKAKIKIIDFGFARYLKKGDLAHSTVGSPINMSPILLRKLNTPKNNVLIGYNEKEDIWSLGTICYELLIGKSAFDSENMDELVKRIELGDYYLPITLSKETVSFLNGMLRYDSKKRLSFDKLSKHKFLTKNINEFTKINLDELQNARVGVLINTKENGPIWDYFGDGN